jgi:hypothetical protein
MTLTVEINHPEFEDDVEFDVAGILVKNGGSVELSEEQERLLVARRRKSVREVLEGNQFVKVKGTSLLSKKDMQEILPPDVEISDLPADTEASMEGEHLEDSNLNKDEGGEA